jgi:molybdate transport system permease protein
VTTSGPPPVFRAARLLVVLAVVLLALPVVGVVARVPWSDAGALLSSPRLLRALGLSVVVAGMSTALAVAGGIPLAAWLAQGSSPRHRAVRALLTLPMVLPPVVAGVGLLFALGRNGVMGAALAAVGVELPFTTAAAIVAATFVAAPFFVLTVEAGFASVDPDAVDVARSLGAGPWLRFRTVVVPALLPSLQAGAALCFARALGEFGATITFAGNLEGRTQTLPLYVYELMQGSPAEAALASLVLVAVAVVVLALQQRVRRALAGGVA